jgi:hypothetical protein
MKKLIWWTAMIVLWGIFFPLAIFIMFVAMIMFIAGGGA